jgi:hypothetical protein
MSDADEDSECILCLRSLLDYLPCNGQTQLPVFQVSFYCRDRFSDAHATLYKAFFYASASLLLHVT